MVHFDYYMKHYLIMTRFDYDEIKVNLVLDLDTDSLFCPSYPTPLRKLSNFPCTRVKLLPVKKLPVLRTDLQFSRRDWQWSQQVPYPKDHIVSSIQGASWTGFYVISPNLRCNSNIRIRICIHTPMLSIGDPPGAEVIWLHTPLCLTQQLFCNLWIFQHPG